jgi:DNA invertase Pin-like site-specific DNA recombinase
VRKSTLPRQRRATLRIAIYLRVSTVKQLEGYGLSTQDEMCRAILPAKFINQPYEIVEVFTDEGVSGKLASRPEFDKMNAMIAAGLIDVVVVAKLDRIGRTMEDIHQWVFDTTKTHKVRVITADSRLDSDDDMMFKLTLSILSWMADMEHVLIKERTMSGREAKMAEGKWGLGVPPFGIRLEGKGKDATPVLNEEEQRTIEIAVECLVDLQKNLAETCDELNVRNRPTRMGGPWNSTSLRKIIMGNALLGFTRVRDNESGLSEAERDDDGNFVHGDTHEFKLPEILPQDRVNAARAAVKRLSWTKTNPAGRSYLLTKRIISRCGSAFIGAQNVSAGTPAAYRCNGSVGHHTRGKQKCGCSQINAEAVEQFVWTNVRDALKNRENLRALADQWLGAIPERSESYRIRIDELEASIEKSRKTRKNAVMALLSKPEFMDDNGNVDQEMLAEVKGSLEKKEQNLEKELRDVQRWLAKAEDEEQRVKDVLALADQISPRLEDLTDRQRQDVIRLFDVKVRVLDDSTSGVLRPSVVEEFFTEHGKLVPDPLTDEQWEQIAHVMPQPRDARDAKRFTSRRLVLDAMFYKARYGLRWTELPEEAVAFTTVRSLKLMAVKMVEEGYLEKAVDLLGDYPGSPVPGPVRLPDVDIQLALADRLTVDELATPASWIRYPCHIEEQSQLLAA